MLKFLRIERPTRATRRSSCGRGVDHLLDAVDVGGERGDDDPPLAAPEKTSSSAGPTLDSDGATPGRSALVESPQRQRTPSRPSSASLRDVGGDAVDRRLVELVVAGDQDRAQRPWSGRRRARRGSSATCGPARSRTARPSSLAGRQLLERDVAELVLVELRAHHPDRQQAAVDHGRDADLAQHVGQGPDVVLVAVGEDDRLDVVGALAQDRRSRAAPGRCRASRPSGTSARCRRPRSGPRARRRSCSCRSPPARPGEDPNAGTQTCSRSRSAAPCASRAPCLSPSAPHRPGPSAAARAGSDRASPSPALTGIGLVTAQRLVDGRSSRRSRGPAIEVAGDVAAS